MSPLQPLALSRRLRVLGLAVGLTAFLFGLTLSHSTHRAALAQGSVDDSLENTSCRETNCMTKFTCNVNGDSWGTNDAFWQQISIIPQKSPNSLARSRTMVWQQANGEFQPFQFTVVWKGSSGLSTQTETVTIGDNGADTGATSHPNIRFHAAGLGLCDGFTPQPPSQETLGGCITKIVYNFDVRKTHGGDELECYVGSYGLANVENADLDAVPIADCGGAVTPWAFPTQKKTNLNCFQSTYIVRYTAP